MTELQPRFLGGVLPPASDAPADLADGLADGQVWEVPPDSRGIWHITTGKSVHVINLDSFQPTYQRLPGSRSKAFDTDGSVHHLTRIDLWPRVGWRFVFRFQDPTRPHEWEKWHATSPVRRIESIDTAQAASPGQPQT